MSDTYLFAEIEAKDDIDDLVLASYKASTVIAVTILHLEDENHLPNLNANRMSVDTATGTTDSVRTSPGTFTEVPVKKPVTMLTRSKNKFLIVCTESSPIDT